MSVQVTNLPSGLTVVTETNPHVKTAAIGVFVAAGSRFERAGEHGLSHFIEHMAFKGTRRRSAREIAETVRPTVSAKTGDTVTAKVLQWPALSRDKSTLYVYAMGFVYGAPPKRHDCLFFCLLPLLAANLGAGTATRVTPAEQTDFEFAPSLSPSGTYLAMTRWDDVRDTVRRGYEYHSRDSMA